MGCLQELSKSTDPDRRLLYGCALDAQETGNRELALMALKLVLDRIGLVAPDVGHIPTILRCTIRLTMAEIEGSRESESSIESLCSLLEKGEYMLLISSGAWNLYSGQPRIKPNDQDKDPEVQRNRVR